MAVNVIFILCQHLSKQIRVWRVDNRTENKNIFVQELFIQIMNNLSPKMWRFLSLSLIMLN